MAKTTTATSPEIKAQDLTEHARGHYSIFASDIPITRSYPTLTVVCADGRRLVYKFDYCHRDIEGDVEFCLYKSHVGSTIKVWND